MTHKYRLLLCLLLIAISGCERQREIIISCKTESGAAIANVGVWLDALKIGITNEQGVVSGMIDYPVGGQLTVRAERDEYYPYSKTVQLPDLPTCGFSIILKAKRYLTVICRVPDPTDPAKRLPLADVTLTIDEQLIGLTNSQGTYVHEFSGIAGETLALAAFKDGYSLQATAPIPFPIMVGKYNYKADLLFQEVQQVEPMTVVVKAMTHPGGKGQREVKIYHKDKLVGATQANGVATVSVLDTPGAPVELVFTAEGFAITPASAVVTMLEQGRSAITVNVAAGDQPPPAPTPQPPKYELGLHFNFYTTSFDSLDVNRWQSVLTRDLKESLATLKHIKLVTTSPSSSGQAASRAGSTATYLLELNLFDEDNARLEALLVDTYNRPWLRVAWSGISADNLDKVTEELVHALHTGFPVTGYVTDLKAGTVTLNIGADRGVQANDIFTDEKFRFRVQISQVQATEATGILMEGRFKVGQKLIRWSPPPVPQNQTTLLAEILDVDTQQPIPAALVYVDGVFSGITDGDGYIGIIVPRKQPYNLEVTKLGYKGFMDQFSHDAELKRQLHLALNYCTLKITSVPSGSSVYLEEQLAGKTPLEVQVKVGFYKLRIEPEDPVNFLSYTYPDRIGLVKSTTQLDILHEGHYLAKARELYHQGKYQQALQFYHLVQMPQDAVNTDSYIEAQFTLGRIYMDQLKQYPEAAEAFENALIWDEKYAACSVNLALAYYHLGNFERANSQFTQALRYKNYLPKNRYVEFMHTILFYSALIQDKLLANATEPETISQLKDTACRQWSEYTDFVARLPKADKARYQKSYDQALTFRRKSCK